MRGRNFFPDEPTRLKIIADLIRLRQDGHFVALWVHDVTIKIQWAPLEPPRLLGWRKAAEMVAAAREAATNAPRDTSPARRIPPARETLQRGAKGQEGAAGGSTGP